jgi:hypothetical protein
MLRVRKRWYIGTLVVLTLAPLVLLTIWGLTWRKPLPPLTYEQRERISKKGVPRAEVERLLGPPTRVESIPQGGTARTVYVYEAMIDDDEAKRGYRYEDMVILGVEYDEAGLVSCVQVAGGHRFTPLGKAINDLLVNAGFV